MRAKGTPQYTQDSVAFPHHYNGGDKNEGSQYDEVSVEFAAKGGGCYGSGVSFKFKQFSSLGRPTYGMEISGWTDGLDNLLDERIQAVLVSLKALERRMDHDDAPKPDQVIALLEANGIKPSGYQLRALGTSRENMPAYVIRTDSL